MKFEEWLSQQNGVIEVDCGCVTTEAFYHWMRVAYEAGNSPVIPDGYVMVPKEPTKEMINAGWLYYMGTKNPSSKGTYKAMLAAAPQSPGSEPATVPGKWIPVSEQMPENDGAYLCWDNRYVTTYAFIFGAWQANQFVAKNITHWMPLPAAPQEVNRE
ncbi:TPA: DUF551 domain-containing protein [Klebsiella pneumoniae]|nr:DUF551 domain-containing protein [Klebsiella pneumoniae]